MTQEYADIIPSMGVDAVTGAVYISGFEWVGDPSLPVKIDHQVIRYVKIWEFPWDLELIEESYFEPTNVYIRKDAGFNYVYYRFKSDWDRYVLRSLYSIGTKLILTAAIWGLAHHRPGYRPSIYDLKWMRSLR